ncbi:hypothetical protein D3C85_1371790 [compost metagenome]
MFDHLFWCGLIDEIVVFILNGCILPEHSLFHLTNILNIHIEFNRNGVEFLFGEGSISAELPEIEEQFLVRLLGDNLDLAMMIHQVIQDLSSDVCGGECGYQLPWP